MDNTAAPRMLGEGGASAPLSPTDQKKRVPYYYENSGRGHDDILRCHECGRLTTYESLMRTGFTPCCGTKRVRQVQHLRFWEWLQIYIGRIDFPRRAEFLKEFSRVRS